MHHINHKGEIALSCHDKLIPVLFVIHTEVASFSKTDYNIDIQFCTEFMRILSIIMRTLSV